MILTENQSLQLACILIEATDEKGPGFVAKVKDAIKKAIDWIKNKLKEFATFFKDKVLRLDGIFKIFKEASDRAHDYYNNRNFKGKKVMVIRAGNIDKFMTSYLDNLSELQKCFRRLDNSMDKYRYWYITDMDKTLLDLDKFIEETKEMADTYEANIDEFNGNYREQVEVPMNEYIKSAKKHMQGALKGYQLNIKVNAEFVKMMKTTISNLEELEGKIAGYKEYKKTNYEGLGLYISRNLKLSGTILKIFFELGRALVRTIGHIVGPLFSFMKKKEDKED